MSSESAAEMRLPSMRFQLLRPPAMAEPTSFTLVRDLIEGGLGGTKGGGGEAGGGGEGGGGIDGGAKGGGNGGGTDGGNGGGAPSNSSAKVSYSL